MCERAVSATSRGVSVASAHHVLKLVRKPCGRASSPRRFSTALSVMSEIGFPRLPTKTWLWRSNRFASCGTNWAADDNGTRCSFPAFILSAGMTQRSLCTSSNVKFLTSPDRAAVRIRKRKAKLVGVPAQRTRKTQVHPPKPSPAHVKPHAETAPAKLSLWRQPVGQRRGQAQPRGAGRCPADPSPFSQLPVSRAISAQRCGEYRSDQSQRQGSSPVSELRGSPKD